MVGLPRGGSFGRGGGMAGASPRTHISVSVESRKNLFDLDPRELINTSNVCQK